MGGVVAVENNKDSAQIAHVGLFSLQHRGQESSGIAVWEAGKESFNVYKKSGLVAGVYTPEILEKLKGTAAIGHVRYPTSGVKSGTFDAQPFTFKSAHGPVSIALSGNIINTEKLREKLSKSGSIFQHNSETEIIVHLLAREKLPIEKALSKALRQIEGGFAAVMLYKNKVLGFRDALGIRPLVLGKLGGTYMLASETAAIEVLGGEYIRDIEPAEIISIENGKVSSSFYTKPGHEQTCIFEQVYFARPDSRVRGRAVEQARMDMGRALARQMKGVKADLVMPVPDSGNYAALGFSKESGIDFQMGFVRNHYMGRSFIKTTQQLREITAKLKLFPIDDVIRGKEIILIDDSIVRGTTARKMINLLREHGAKKIHFAVTSPPITAPCFYGINTPSKKELIACQMPHGKIAAQIGVDTLTFIKSENAVGACAGWGEKNTFCLACFTDKYPTKISAATRAKR